MLSSASVAVASATTIVKTYIASASPASSNNSTATDSGAGSRHLASGSAGSVSASTKSSKASGKSGKANPTGLESYTVCVQAIDIVYSTSSDLDRPDPSIVLPFLPKSLELGFLTPNVAESLLIGDIGCGWFGLNRTACDDDGYAPVKFLALTSTAYAIATGSNPLEFTGTGGVFSDIIPGEAKTTAGEGLITTYSLKCATPPVTKFETKEQGVRPANICAFELGVQITELDLIAETEGTIALYPESDEVECGVLKEE